MEGCLQLEKVIMLSAHWSARKCIQIIQVIDAETAEMLPARLEMIRLLIHHLIVKIFSCINPTRQQDQNDDHIFLREKSDDI